MSRHRVPSVLLGATLLISTFGMVSWPAAQQGATLRGRVEIGIPVAVQRPSDAYSRSISTTDLAPTSELSNVVVYLRDAPARPVPPGRAQIRQVGETFVPRIVAVTVGSDVDFPNDDPIYHNVFSLSRTRTFDLGRYPQGTSRRVHFDKPGIVRVFCQIHSHMSATVAVFDHPWYATPDAQGRFELTGLPAGARRITAWHERLGDTTLDLRLDPGRTAEVGFVLPVPRRP